MKRIHIRAIGGLSEAWQREASESLKTRLSPYAKLDITELSEGHKGAAKPDIAKTRFTEAEGLRRGIARYAPTANPFVIALTEGGKEYDSPAFAKQLETWSESGRPLVFLIGGSWGLDESLLKGAHAKLSLGKMTWPHGMARLLLLEQLFRAEAISRGKEYHK
jgi:23S rRNA (pseudouridine1915-N3)-methyltransferase